MCSQESVKIGLNGYWYELTESFIKFHPGGEQFLKDYRDKDATVVFRLTHYNHSNILNDMVKSDMIRNTKERYPLVIDEVDKTILKYYQKVITENDCCFSLSWFIGKVLFIVVCHLLCIVGINCNFLPNSIKYIILPFILSIGWEQAAFLLHDGAHSNITFNRKIDIIIGSFFGNFGIAFNPVWWKPDHFIHHVYTKAIDRNIMIDTQPRDPTWCDDISNIDKQFFNMFEAQKTFFIPNQHYLFLLLHMTIGKLFVSYKSYMDSPRKTSLHFKVSLVAFLLQIIYHLYFFGILFYCITAGFTGILTIILFINHMGKPWKNQNDIIKSGWAKHQISEIRDIANPEYLDWFYGGLNYHLVHHLFPKLPRHKFRQVNKDIRALLKKHHPEIDLHRVNFSTAIYEILQNLKHVATQFVNMKRKKM